MHVEHVIRLLIENQMRRGIFALKQHININHFITFLIIDLESKFYSITYVT